MSEVAPAAGVVSSAAPTTPSAVAAPVQVSTPGLAPASSSNDWTSSFDPDVKGYVQNAGFKDPASVVDAYRNLEKLIGAPKERVLKIPEKPDDSAWNDVYSKLGKPATAKDYKIEVPKGADPAFAEWAKNTFHEVNLTAAQAEKLAAKWNEHMAGTTAAQQSAYQAKAEQEEKGLQKEWGAAFEQNINVAKRAAQAFGLSGEVVDKLEQAMGYAGVMKFMHTLGSKVGEDSFVTGKGGGSFGAMTPEAARNRISALRQDGDFVRRYTAGEVSAKEEMAKLHAWAYPE